MKIYAEMKLNSDHDGCCRLCLVDHRPVDRLYHARLVHLLALASALAIYG